MNAGTLLLAFLLGSPAAGPRLQDGDIVFHTSRSAQSLAVQRATRSRYSHMGIVLHRGGRPYVLEAISTVQYTPLEKWIARGTGGHVVAKRLRNRGVLSPAALEKVRAQARGLQGRRYDLTFEWSDEKIYCSELVWKVYERAVGLRIGELQKIRDLSLEGPAVRQKMRERYGNAVPLDEPVIAPGAMFDSPLLETVFER